MKHGTELLLKETLSKNIVATVEERRDGMFIATVWDNEFSYENDRVVMEFETESAAREHMYKSLFEIAKDLLRK